MPYFKTQRGIHWHYEVAGQGDPVVFIHGFGGSGNWWQAQKEFLQTDYQVITMDLPGHGRTKWVPVTLAEMASDIRQLLYVLEVPHISVVASSFGGLVALEIYRLMPQLVMRMSLVGGIPKFARSDDYPAGLDIEKIRTLSRQFDGDYAAIMDIFFRSLFTIKERESPHFITVKELWRQGPLPVRESLKAFLDILENTDLRDRMASVICPLQFITGTQDYICPRPVMDWLAEHAHNARFDFIEDCGHLPFLTESKEYNRLLEDFLIH